jgi:signal peptidase I
MSMRFVRRGATTATLLIGAVAVVAALSLTGLRLLGYQPEVVYTGSMRPTFPIGSLVFAHSVPSSSVKVGDVISFVDPMDGTKVITHRVVRKLQRGDGSLAYRTKGDFNSARDPWNLALPARAGKIAFHVPVAGYVLWYGRTREARLVLVAAIAFALLGSLLRAIWRQEPQSDPVA